MLRSVSSSVSYARMRYEKDHARDHVAVAVAQHRRFFGAPFRNEMCTCHEFFSAFVSFDQILILCLSREYEIDTKREPPNRAV